MKKHFTTLLFASLAVVVLAVPARAVVEIVITPQGSPEPGLDAWLVTAVGSGGDLVGGFSELMLTGGHQTWVNPAFSTDSPLFFSLNPGNGGAAAGNAAWTPLDTHLLVDPTMLKIWEQSGWNDPLITTERILNAADLHATVEHRYPDGMVIYRLTPPKSPIPARN